VSCRPDVFTPRVWIDAIRRAGTDLPTRVDSSELQVARLSSHRQYTASVTVLVRSSWASTRRGSVSPRRPARPYVCDRTHKLTVPTHFVEFVRVRRLCPSTLCRRCTRSLLISCRTYSQPFRVPRSEPGPRPRDARSLTRDSTLGWQALAGELLFRLMRTAFVHARRWATRTARAHFDPASRCRLRAAVRLAPIQELGIRRPADAISVGSIALIRVAGSMQSDTHDAEIGRRMHDGRRADRWLGQRDLGQVWVLFVRRSYVARTAVCRSPAARMSMTPILNSFSTREIGSSNA